ncbi:MAG: hypothetical protein EHM61_10260 [Acidobacteria bacterium]|nr:MAG: hypothetical protein EHM61_10260 [Acidobacteriota bacterium]
MTARKGLSIFALTTLFATLASAQPARLDPHIGYLYPAGGQQGKSFQILAGGQFLRGVRGVRVSGDGVQARVIRHYPPLRNLDKEQRQELQRRFMDLRRKRLAEAGGRGAEFRGQRRGPEAPESAKPVELPQHPLLENWESLSLRELEGLSRELLNIRKKQANAQIAEMVRIEVTIDPAAQPGNRELRLETPAGLTNPLRFQVGLLPEAREVELNDPSAPPNLPDEPALELPILVNGQIKPGDIDRFRVKARRGQRLVINIQARQLIPYLADAVPGWFQPTVALYDARGKEIQFADDYRFNPDPVLFYQIPEDAEYEVEIRDSLYRGREDFVYRVVIGEQPFITQMFPLGAQRGAAAQASINGWNLGTNQLTLDTTPGEDHIREGGVRTGDWLSNPVRYAADETPDCVETEPNDAASSAQQMVLPITVNGRINRPGDADFFKVKGRAGDLLVAEVWGRRLYSPLDSLLRLTDLSGKVLEWNDDHEDKEMGLLTHHADSYLRVRLPVDGVYCVQLTDSQSQGSDAHAYRLYLGPARPDFALRVTPSSLNVFAGGSVALSVHALRKDGFEGEVEVFLKDSPPGFRLSGGKIPAGKEQVRVTLTAPAQPFPEPLAFQLEGRARLAGQTIKRLAIPSEDMMQAFAFRHLVPSAELLVAVRGGNRRRNPPVLAGEGRVTIPLGGTAEVRIKTGAAPRRPVRANALESIKLELDQPPEGLTLADVRLSADGVVLVVKCDAEKCKAGTTDNLIVAVFYETPPQEGQPGNGKPARQNRRMSLGVLPAIPFEIVER